MPQPEEPLPIESEPRHDEGPLTQGRADIELAFAHGARGAAIIAGVSVAILLIGWLLFYFCLFLRRGYVG